MLRVTFVDAKLVYSPYARLHDSAKLAALATALGASRALATEHRLFTKERRHLTEWNHYTIPRAPSDGFVSRRSKKPTPAEWFLAHLGDVRRCTRILDISDMPDDAVSVNAASGLIDGLPSLHHLALERVPALRAMRVPHLRSLAVVDAPTVPIADLSALRHLTVLHLRGARLGSDARPPPELRIVSIIDTFADGAEFYAALSHLVHLRIALLHGCLELLTHDEAREFATTTSFVKCAQLRCVSIMNMKLENHVRAGGTSLQEQFVMYLGGISMPQSAEFRLTVRAKNMAISNVPRVLSRYGVSRSEDPCRTDDDDDHQIVRSLIALANI
eukprot:gene2781-3567_t